MKKLLVSGLILSLTLGGCASYGPATLKETHPLYNQSIVQSLNEQFLLNLVRLRYRDTPYFLEIGNITSSQTLSGSASVGANWQGISDVSRSVSPSASGTITQRPTITYQPLTGEAFLKKLMSPIPLEAILILTQSGWLAERVFGLTIERVNGLDNAVMASGPTPGKAPRYETFKRFTTLLGKLQKADRLRLGVRPNGKDNALVLHIVDDPAMRDTITEFKNLLQISSSNNAFLIVNDWERHDANAIALRSRSVLSILFYLSHAVDAPAEHEQAGLVTVTKHTDGARFNWDEVSGTLLKVHTAPNKPANAFVAVEHRGHWFYIKDDDLNSKSTFMLLGQLFNLQAGNVQTLAPALTISVGG